MNTKNDAAISRREFARRAALVSAAASLSPVELLKAEAAATAIPASHPSDEPKFSPESQIEADSRMQTILARYGNRLSDAQKADLSRLSHSAQEMLDRLRAYSVENGDGAGLYLKPLIEREKKPVSTPSSAKPAAAQKKP